MVVRAVKEVRTTITVSRDELMSLLIEHGVVSQTEVPSSWGWFINCDEDGLVVHWSTEVRRE